MSKTYLRKRQVAQRYGDITLRSVERAVVAGRLPAPEYPCGEHTPLWDLAKLEANERTATIRGNALYLQGVGTHAPTVGTPVAKQSRGRRVMTNANRRYCGLAGARQAYADANGGLDEARDFVLELNRVLQENRLEPVQDERATASITIATNMGSETVSATDAEAKEYQRDPFGFGARYFGFRNRNEYGMWIGKVKPAFGVGFILIK